MRTHLISTVKNHLGDFSARLREHNTVTYKYSPMSRIQYKRLEKEIFCHKYYLNNLCDEKRFPDWLIHEPCSVFEACIQQWKAINTRVRAEESSLKINEKVCSKSKIMKD